MDNNKLKLWAIIPVCAIVLLIGGTYAWYVWQTTQDEETIIATDTGYAKVFFDGGSDISGKLKPLSDKSKGMSKEITVIADKEFIEPISFNLYLDINSIDTGLKHESFKFELYKDGELVKAGNFSDAYLTSALSNCDKNTGVRHIILTSDTVATTEAVYTLYTWIDGNMNNPLSMESQNFDFTLHADGQHAILGEGDKGESDDTTSESLIHNGIIPEGGTYIRGAAPDAVNNHNMTNATTYTTGQSFPETVEYGDIYQFGDYEYVYGYENDYDPRRRGFYWLAISEYDKNGWGVRVLDDTKNAYGEILKSINSGNVVSMTSTFADCYNLVTAPKIPDSVTHMKYTFEVCESLITAPEIPDSVISMNSTFSECASLVTAPVIPDSVADMDYTFSDCESLVNAPKIPNSVTNMKGTFLGCTSLVTAPEIPDLVTDMSDTFYGCTSLTGTVRINSDIVSSFKYGSGTYIGVFFDTVLPITVEVPEGSTTYDNISKSGVVPKNVTITTFVKE